MEHLFQICVLLHGLFLPVRICVFLGVKNCRYADSKISILNALSLFEEDAIKLSVAQIFAHYKINFYKRRTPHTTVCYTDGTLIDIDCLAVEDEVARQKGMERDDEASSVTAASGCDSFSP